MTIITVSYYGAPTRCLTVEHDESLVDVIMWMNRDDSVKAYYIHK